MRDTTAAWRNFAAAFLFFALVALPGAAVARPSWPQEHSDLKADPAITFGTLSNGLRYAIQRNASPPGQVAMRLMITAGSMQEEKDQEGLAHFLEHMAFHGSTHVPDGEMALTLQRLGMRLGADINAGTGRDLTVYKFNLTKSDDASVETTLNLFREIGSELTLDPAVMNNERNVILAEAHSRTASQQKLEADQFAAVFGDHPFARPPIGREDVILHAPIERMRAFYDAYYRPERAVVIVVGDVDPAKVEAMIKAHFSDWRGRGRPGKDPAPPASTMKTPAFKLSVIKGLELSSQSLRLFFFHSFAPPKPSVADEEARFVYIIAGQTAENRLIQLNEQSGKPFTNGLLVAPLGLPRTIANIDFGGAGLVSDWQKALTLLIKTQRQVLEGGISQTEVDGAITLQRAALTQWLSQSSNQSSVRLADGIVSDVQNNSVPRSPQQDIDLFNEAVKGLTAERVNATLREHLGAPLIYFSTSYEPEGGEAAIRSVYEAAMKAPVDAFKMATSTPWPYVDFGRPGVVAVRRTRDDLGVTFVRFANGVRLTIRPTAYAADQVLVNVRFGHGQLDLPKDRVAASDFAAQVFTMGGFRDLTQAEAARSVAGQLVGFEATAGDDSFTLSGPSEFALRPDMFEREMQILAAKIAYPGWRTDDWQSMIASLSRDDDARDASPQAVYRNRVPELTHPGDQRWVIDTAEMRRGWRADDAVAFIKPIVEKAPLDIVVVGDIAVDRVIETVGRTFGALPTRSDAKEPAGLRDVKLPTPSPTPVELHHNGPDYQAMVVVDWLATDAFADPKQTQAARVLADIMMQRAFEQIRNKEGSSYSPTVAAGFSEVLPKYGMISALLLVPPADVDRVFADLDAIADDLAARDVSADEFQRAQSARLNLTRRFQRSNGYWLHYLEGAQTDPRLLNFAAREETDVASLTPADIRAAAQRWLKKSNSWRLKITPGGP